MFALRKPSWLTGRWAVVYLSIHGRPEKTVMVDWTLGSCLSIYPYVVALRKPSWLIGRWAGVYLSIRGRPEKTGMVDWTLGSCLSICPCMILVAAARKSKTIFVQSTAVNLWVTIMELLGRVLQPCISPTSQHFPVSVRSWR